MDIRFACDHCGSRFRVEEKMAGKPAKCPKCGAELTVPDITDASFLAAEVEDSKINRAVAGKAEAGDGSSAGDSKNALPQEDQIVFLCPNGHELHGPARLQGQPGACPHCKVRFQIPNYDEEEEQTGFFGTEEFSLTEDNKGEASSSRSSGDSGILEYPGDLSSDGFGIGSMGGGGGGSRATARRQQPMRGAFAWLWEQRGNLGQFEVHLKENPEVLKASLFARRLSKGSCAVFAYEEGDGSFTVMSVPWENVSHITLRRIEEIDEDEFEEPDEHEVD